MFVAMDRRAGAGRGDQLAECKWPAGRLGVHQHAQVHAGMPHGVGAGDGMSHACSLHRGLLAHTVDPPQVDPQFSAKTVKATFTRTARKSLANSKQAKFTISTTFKPTSGGVTIKQLAHVTIKR